MEVYKAPVVVVRVGKDVVLEEEALKMRELDEILPIEQNPSRFWLPVHSTRGLVHEFCLHIYLPNTAWWIPFLECIGILDLSIAVAKLRRELA